MLNRYAIRSPYRILHGPENERVRERYQGRFRVMATSPMRAGNTEAVHNYLSYLSLPLLSKLVLAQLDIRGTIGIGGPNPLSPHDQLGPPWPTDS